jgi:hypothetical protein
MPQQAAFHHLKRNSRAKGITLFLLERESGAEVRWLPEDLKVLLRHQGSPKNVKRIGREVFGSAII